MRYSVHNVMRGGFDYYDGPDVTPINDDQPTPSFDSSIRTPLGIPASLAGRPLPPNASIRGHGATAQGAVSSGKRGSWSTTAARNGGMPSGIGAALGLDDSTSRMLQAVVGIVGFAGIFYLITRFGDRERKRVR
ncbi:MAG: hypothetical protein WC683_02460 [bacterium]